jgi:hypothetical protein
LANRFVFGWKWCGSKVSLYFEIPLAARLHERNGSKTNECFDPFGKLRMKQGEDLLNPHAEPDDLAEGVEAYSTIIAHVLMRIKMFIGDWYDISNTGRIVFGN